MELDCPSDLRFGHLSLSPPLRTKTNFPEFSSSGARLGNIEGKGAAGYQSNWKDSISIVIFNQGKPRFII
jgi:hypothetical protein